MWVGSQKFDTGKADKINRFCFKAGFKAAILDLSSLISVQ
jgi:hypothetical protein